MPIEVTKNAFDRIAYIKKQENNPKLVFQLSVLGGGCSGLQYQFDFVENSPNNDFKFEQDGAVVVIDKESALFLNGAKLDYIEELGYARFEIINPNAVAKCGCGSSFAI